MAEYVKVLGNKGLRPSNPTAGAIFKASHGGRPAPCDPSAARLRKCLILFNIPTRGRCEGLGSLLVRRRLANPLLQFPAPRACGFFLSLKPDGIAGSIQACYAILQLSGRAKAQDQAGKNPEARRHAHFISYDVIRRVCASFTVESLKPNLRSDDLFLSGIP